MILRKQSRRRFFKNLMSLSAFGAASAATFRRRGKGVSVDIGPEEAHAMNNPEYTTHPAKQNVIDSRGLGERYFTRSTLPSETQILRLGYPT